MNVPFFWSWAGARETVSDCFEMILLCPTIPEIIYIKSSN